jgi:hypothetical protein
MCKKSGSIRDEQPGSYFRELRNNFLGLKYLNSLTRIRDGKNSYPEWKNFGSGLNIPDPQHWDYGIFEIKSHTTDLRELCSCAGQLAIRGSPAAAAAGSPAVFTGLSSGAHSLFSGAPSFSSGAPSLAASAGSWGGLSGGVSSDARNSFRFTCGSASP